MKIDSIADLARGRLQRWIIQGEYPPGRQLKEEEIAKRLGISRPPVREAFKMLEAEGLVIRRPRRGVFVSEMTRKDVWEAYTLKAALYEMAVGLAMDTVTSSQIIKLEAMAERMEKCVAARPIDLLRYQEHHQNFHDQIMVISGHVRLRKIAASIHNQVSRFSYKSLQNQAHLDASVRNHRQIINAIKAGDKVMARQVMKAHVLEALEVLLGMPGLQKKELENELSPTFVANFKPI